MTMSRAALGRALLAFRKQAGLTQRACAELVGVTDKAVSKWECGDAYPSMEALVALARCYRVPLHLLFEAAEEPAQEADDSTPPALELPCGPPAAGTARTCYLIRRPAGPALDALFGPAQSHVERTFLVPRGGQTRCLVAYRTPLVHLFALSCETADSPASTRLIARAEHDDLLPFADPGMATLVTRMRTRRSHGQVLTVETYPFLPFSATAAVDHAPDEPPRLPRPVTAIRDITGSGAFAPATLAHALAQGRL